MRGIPGEGVDHVAANRFWLSPAAGAEVELNTELLPTLLREYRREHQLSQAELAQILNFDQSYVPKVENGQRQVRDLDALLHIAQQLDVAPSRLGLAPEALQPVAAPSTSVLAGAADPVHAAQQEWRRVRQVLKRDRRELARRAAGLYRPEVRVGGLLFLAAPGWLPDKVVPLENIRLVRAEDRTPVPVTGTEPEAAAVLPLRAPGHRFARYTSAMKHLDRPALFENRPSYRLLDVDLSAAQPTMTFGLATYFDKLDLCLAVAHELAAQDRPDWSRLPLRALVGDPFDLHRRAVLPGIQTLTLRRDRRTGEATFLLHWRDPAKVATPAGSYSLIPAGEFQPSSIAAWDRDNDFDLWRNMVREFAEELLGEPERDGSSGTPLDYENWPLYRRLEQARRTGAVAVHCLGMGLDPLLLYASLLTVVVLDDDVFDELFGDTVRTNDEGVLVTTAESGTPSEGIPFTEASVRRLLDHEPLSAMASCLLDRAWRFRRDLLPPP